MSVLENRDIFFSSNFETLCAYMSSALDAGDYKTARLYASLSELILPIDNDAVILQFYAIQMVFNDSYYHY
jgi:hypothetical protein